MINVVALTDTQIGLIISILLNERDALAPCSGNESGPFDDLVREYDEIIDALRNSESKS